MLFMMLIRCDSWVSGFMMCAVYEVGSQAPSGVFPPLFLVARTLHATSFLPVRWRLPAPRFSSIFSPSPLAPRPTGGRAATGKKCSATHRTHPASGRWHLPRVGGRDCGPGAVARTTVYPWGTGHGPQHLLPYTPQASGTP